MKYFIGLLTVATGLWAGAEEVSFNADIRPIFSKHCMTCHGPDAGLDEHGKSKRKGELRLDRAEGPEGAYRVLDGVQAIKPGDLKGSELWRRITTDDADDRMPPVKAHVDPLTSAEKETLRKWIVEGAKYEEFWSFVPARERELPGVKNKKWSARPIDQFTLAKMEEKGLVPNARADKRTLIRRVSFDLTGLPPSLEEIEEFLADHSEDAYERLVSRLMEKPQYGEHMAKYWLDLVRFADTNGMHHDHYRDMTPYRDWVIRSFNENLGYDEFVKYQVAGDLYPEPSTEQLIGSGFNRLHLIIDVGTALPEESFTKNVIDRVSAVGTAFMGMTLGCAVCHDHKFDPLTQKEFFQLYAFFNNFDGEPETGRRSGSDFKRGLQAPYIMVPTAEEKEKLAALDVGLEGLEGELKALQAAEARDEGAIKAKEGELKKAQEARGKFEETLRGAMVMKERTEVRPAHVLVRGAYDQPGEEVQRDTPAFLPPLKAEEGTRDRMDLAEWLVAPENPLTARVEVNRIWQQFFGVGLVKTAEDFGVQGQWPSHPKLLDYLTTEFVASRWDVKALVRMIVLSETYQQSSVAPRERFVTDPENRMLARGSRFRLDSEMIRDQVLAVSGLLNLEMYGFSVKPPQPAGLWKAVAMPSSYPREYVADAGGKIHRRSIYTFWKRGMPPPQMSIFDAPTREACIARRERTNTPLQALVLMNEDQYFGAAKKFAENLFEVPELNEDQRLARAYETVTSQEPSELTVGKLREGLKGFRGYYSSNPDLAKAVAGEEGDEVSRAERAAWTMLVHSLLNLDVVKTHE
ncbi:MAG: PSD1 and planctomycete cytochrome C domain-containing protein [Verrucomicrobia bacterium]|nr:PSD1 and planctomycete cytochrome C domain-containing protein [Verrucomicrobiota bacterium]MDA1005427.1 PSD1 and planctomycete cytochrome C domain-containing protein [Verrucomicrobiota bacterium]